MKTPKQIQKLLQKIETTTGWKSIINWSDKKYTELSEAIFEKTNIQISHITLKRISGKIETPDDYIPSETTLDAMSQYLGFKDWYDFAGPKKKSLRLKSLFVFLVLISALAVGFFILRKSKDINPGNSQLSVKESVGKSPFTAVFDYQIPENNDGNYVLEFGDFSTQPEPHLRPRTTLSRNNNIYTHMYSYPDYFTAKLLYEDKIIKEIKIQTLTDGWKGMYLSKHKTHRLMLDYPPIKDGKLYISKNEIDSILMKKEYEQSWLFYIYSDTFSFTADNIIAEAEIRSREIAEIESGCHFGQLSLTGENGSLSMRICDEGCTEWIKLMAGQKYLKGKENDFSNFGTDMTKWNDLKMICKNKHLEYYLNDKLIYTAEFTTDIGKLKTIHFDFSVSGEVDFIKISDLKGKILYNDDF